MAYFVNPNNTSILYGDGTASHPEPEFLYREIPAVGEYMTSTKKWIPNCYLFDPKFYRCPDGQWNSASASAVKSDIQSGIEKVKGTMDGRVVKLGIVALNDCARFAVTLMRIMEAKGIVGGMTESDNLTCSEAAMRAVPDLGDTFLLNYGGAFHGITVVAVSPMNEFVTLEAHASKLLKTPEFHCYSGMIDFVAKNFTVDRRADGRVQLIPHTAGAGIISTSGLSIQAMEDACGELENLVKSNDDKRIFDRLQAPEDPRVTTYVPALYKS